MFVNTRELIGVQLDWVVASCKDIIYSNEYHPSTSWAHGGPIIEEMNISTIDKRFIGDPAQAWMCYFYSDTIANHVFGPTQLVAAMRKYVLFYKGEIVYLPNDLNTFVREV